MSSEPSPQRASAVPRVQIIGITGIPEIGPGDELGPIILAAAEAQGTAIEDGDVVVVTQKIVSKAEGRVVNLSDVVPSPFACRLAEEMGRDGRLVELVLRESRSIVRMDVARGSSSRRPGTGFICANAGIDASNVPGDQRVCLLPEDPDRSAARIRDYIQSTPPGARVAVIISDTFGRAWREGHVNFAVGVAA